MKNYDSIIIGHVSKDINIDCEGVEVRIYGGASVYASAAAHALGHSTAVITKHTPDDRENILGSFVIPGEDIYSKEEKICTSIRNQYLTPDKERRICTCVSQGEGFDISDIPDYIGGRVYHFAGLIYGDFTDGLIISCAEKGDVAVDVQGMLRHADRESGNMFFEDWATKKEVLPHIRFLKTDAAEAEIMTGTSDRREAARMLHSWGAKEILITHNTEVLAFDGETMLTCPIRARNLSGRTGRGDTTFATYINERLDRGMAESLLTATALVSLKMETPGPFKGRRADVEKYISELYADELARLG